MDFLTYTNSRREDYEALAETVASILRAAIASHPVRFRLQQIQHRAKNPESLKKKLTDRKLETTKTLEDDIKDLAGCRLIFYTNADVSSFLQSGIIQDNFDVDWERTKIHHPVPGQSDPSDLFISNNYVVKLKENRTQLPEYARFAGLACEVQVQTTLNHAWSEMEHDILYKKPKLNGFGGRLFEAIEQRFQKIMRTYLLPAGYEFQKAIDDYERLMNGKELFESGSLKALSECDNNNTRLELLERFRDYVLPNYDDPQSVYPEIKEHLVSGIKAARATAPRMIETPFGSFPGATADRVAEIACEILTQLRYVQIETTFDAICELFPGAESHQERKHLMELAERLAQHNLDAWKQVGPAVQMALIQKIRSLPPQEMETCRPLLRCVSSEILNTEVKGTSSTYNTVTFHSGSVVASDALTKLRADAIDLLTTLYNSASSQDEREATRVAIFAAANMPTQASYSDELLITVLSDCARVVDFCSEVGSSDAFETIQKAEHDILWLHRRNLGLQNDPKTDASVLAAANSLTESIQRFRRAVDANQHFTVYKTLVGYDSVFPQMWQNEDFDLSEAETYRNERIDELVAQVNENRADEWFAIITRCSQTDSSDLATFPSFGRFLERLAKSQPSIVLSYTQRLGERLTGFLGIMLSGLSQSEKKNELQARLSQWLDQDKYLPQLAHYCSLAPILDADLLRKVLQAGIRLKDDAVVTQALSAAFRRYKDGTSNLIAEIIMPGIAYFAERKDARWLHLAWFLPKDASPLIDLTTEQVDAVLKSLVFYPDIDGHADRVLSMLANTHPKRVFDFFGDRLAYARERSGDDKYKEIPYHLYGLDKKFASIADHSVATVRTWFVSGDPLFQFTGGRLIASCFPDFPDALKEKLSDYVKSGVREDIEFVLEILSSYRGQPFLHEMCKDIVHALPKGDKLLDRVQLILDSTGVVNGEFGFVEAYKQKRTAAQPWLENADPKVRSFAERYVALLDRQIAAEQRRSEEDLEMRKRMYENPGT